VRSCGSGRLGPKVSLLHKKLSLTRIWSQEAAFTRYFFFLQEVMAAAAASYDGSTPEHRQRAGRKSDPMVLSEINGHSVGSLAAMSGVGLPPCLPCSPLVHLHGFCALSWTSVRRGSAFHVIRMLPTTPCGVSEAVLTPFLFFLPQ
jgi:hypothetical protein